MQRRRSYTPRSRLDLSGTTVVKESEDRADLEFAKARALAQVADRCAFVAPPPRRYDLAGRTVTYERIDVGVALATLVPTGRAPLSSAAVAAFASAGVALANIHAHLQVEGGVHRPLPAEVARFLPEATRRRLETEGREHPVVSHGDFSFWNVFTRGSDDDATVVVLDCCPNLYTSFDAIAHESRYLDLGLFDSCLLGRAGLRDYVRTRRQHLCTLRRAFLDGYEGAGGVTIDRDHLRATSRAVLAAYLVRRRGWPPAASALAGYAISLRQRDCLT
ncbi:MAG: hypothetical protein JWM47_78 [Acidimicrobiales bacterium]|nr:hypothetical protein [Acidimicrobiales bacterium]